jgi:hypothetical protein
MNLGKKVKSLSMGRKSNLYIVQEKVFNEVLVGKQSSILYDVISNVPLSEGGL